MRHAKTLLVIGLIFLFPVLITWQTTSQPVIPLPTPSGESSLGSRSEATSEPLPTPVVEVTSVTTGPTVPPIVPTYFLVPTITPMPAGSETVPTLVQFSVPLETTSDAAPLFFTEMPGTGQTATPQTPETTPLTGQVSTRVSADGKYIGYLNAGSLQLLDAATGETIDLPEGMPKDIADLAWSPDSTLLAVGTNSGEILIYDLAFDATEKLTTHLYAKLLHGSGQDTEGKTVGINFVNWSYTGEYLASTGLYSPYNLQVWDMKSLKPVLSAVSGNSSNPVWSPVNNTLAVASIAGVRLLDIDQLPGASVMDLDFPEWQAITRRVGQETFTDPVTPLAWNPTGDQLAVANWFGRVWMIDVETGSASLFAELDQSRAAVSPFGLRSLQWSQDGQQLSGSVWQFGISPAEVRVWDVETGTLLHTFQTKANLLNRIDVNPITGQLVFGDVPDNADGANLIASGAVRIVDLANLTP